MAARGRHRGGAFPGKRVRPAPWACPPLRRPLRHSCRLRLASSGENPAHERNSTPRIPHDADRRRRRRHGPRALEAASPHRTSLSGVHRGGGDAAEHRRATAQGRASRTRDSDSLCRDRRGGRPPPLARCPTSDHAGASGGRWRCSPQRGTGHDGLEARRAHLAGSLAKRPPEHTEPDRHCTRRDSRRVRGPDRRLLRLRVGRLLDLRAQPRRRPRRVAAAQGEKARRSGYVGSDRPQARARTSVASCC